MTTTTFTVARSLAAKRALLKGSKKDRTRPSTAGLVARMLVTGVTVGCVFYVSFVIGVLHTDAPSAERESAQIQQHHAKSAT